LDSAAAEGLLSGRGAAAGAPAGQQALARVLAVASGPASDIELTGQAAALAAFAAATGPAGQHRQHRSVIRKRRLLVSHLTTKLALAAAACLMALGGAAYTSALPAPLQQLAHVTFGAPAPRHAVPRPPATGASPGQQGRQAGRPNGQPGGQKGSPNGGTGRQAADHGKSHPSGKPHRKAHRASPHGHQASPGSHPTQPTHLPSAASGPHVPGSRA
jgi:hypothetical protein